MCGICGAVWTDHGRGPGDEQLEAMVARLEHRGPDEAGTYRDRHAALGFRRLSILDLPGGHQPLGNEDGTVRVVFNGEIYNFPALRHRLEARGHTLRSTGDTEVLLRAYEVWGAACLPKLNGMFAFAVWDEADRSLFLARDRMGQKPLYYAVAPGGRTSSQVPGASGNGMRTGPCSSKRTRSHQRCGAAARSARSPAIRPSVRGTAVTCSAGMNGAASCAISGAAERSAFKEGCPSRARRGGYWTPARKRG